MQVKDLLSLFIVYLQPVQVSSRVGKTSLLVNM